MAPLAPYSPAKVKAEAERADYAEQRLAAFGSEAKLPENQPPRHLAIQIGQALHEVMAKYPQSLLFGEDVAQKGGVYTVTKGLHKTFKSARVFNTLLDETIILGLAQGFANMGMLPIPEIQYLAYFHNAGDQIRGEAASLQFFSNDQYRNPMVMRIASLGYQRGFGGHFHNDNSITALRDIPGLVVGCPSRGDDAATMLRTLMALATVDGRVCAFLEPIALYMTKDLYEAGDGQWQFAYPAPGEAMPLGEGRVYAPEAQRPGRVHLRQRRADGAARGARYRGRAGLEGAGGGSALAGAAQRCLHRGAGAQRPAHHRAGRGPQERGCRRGRDHRHRRRGPGRHPMERVVGADTFTPLAGAAFLVLPGEADVVAAAKRLAG